MPEAINSKVEIDALEKVDDAWPEFSEIVLKRALQKKRPEHIRLVLLVRWERKNMDYQKTPVPVVVAI